MAQVEVGRSYHLCSESPPGEGISRVKSSFMWSNNKIKIKSSSLLIVSPISVADDVIAPQVPSTISTSESVHLRGLAVHL